MTVEVLSGSGTWDWSAAGSPAWVEVYAFGGGGSGGSGSENYQAAGGGGAGGMYHHPCYVTTGDIAYSVGGGGSAVAAGNSGNAGSATTFGAISAPGGAPGAHTGGVGSGGTGVDGGCGGGAGIESGSGRRIGGRGTAGYHGGNSAGAGANANRSGGGGGGVGGPGANAASGDGGDGGVGIDLSALVGTGIGDSGWFGGGGAGSGDGSPTGGNGGGGDGKNSGGGVGGSGQAGTGGGGGAARQTTSGAGGSGTILLIYDASDPLPTTVTHIIDKVGADTWDWEAAGSPSVIDEVHLLAGGGGGAGYLENFGATGGGGAGEYVKHTAVAVSADVSIIVGAGGAPRLGASSEQGNDGADTEFGALTAEGGGGGARFWTVAGNSGGCGGGGSGDGGTGPGGSGSAGGDGGTGASTGSNTARAGGGGGGMGGNGGNAVHTDDVGVGGVGIDVSADLGTDFGVAGWIAGGGGGRSGIASNTPGGQGGGGAGGFVDSLAEHGLRRTGGGGGATSGTFSGGGGSGAIVLVYTLNEAITIETTASRLRVRSGVTSVSAVAVIQAVASRLRVRSGVTSVFTIPPVVIDTSASRLRVRSGITSVAITIPPFVPVGYWLEVWRRPGAADFDKVIDSPPFRESSYHIGVNLPGDGTMVLPDTFDRFNDILDVTNEVGSLVRIREDQTSEIVGEWVPSLLTPVADKDDPFIRVGGAGMNSVLGYAIAEAWDWDGSLEWVSRAPDWIWGGDNLLTNPGFEENQVEVKKIILQITATGGTYTLTDGTDTTSAIAHNALASTIANEIESDLGLLPDVVVVQTGTSPTTFEITFVDPPFGVNIGINTGSLTGGSGTTQTSQEGGLQPTGWTKSRPVVANLSPDAGFYDQFVVSDNENHTPGGTYSLAIEPGPSSATTNRTLGAQQVVNVTPGQIYQASIWVYPLSATDRYRLSLWTFGEELIAADDIDGSTLTANTWNELTISDIIMPEGVTQAIFRVAYTNPGPYTPSLFYIDDASFVEGYAPTTVGEIIRFLYEDATVNHVADGRLVWEDEANPGNPYLTLDFDDVNDSAGQPWANPEVRIRISMRMDYLQVSDALEGLEGIEWRVVPADPVTGTGGWLWQVYNEGGMDDAPAVALQGASQDTRRALRRLRPKTAWMIEGRDILTARATDSTNGFGRIESARLDNDVTSMDGATDEANLDKANALIMNDVWSYELLNPANAPLYHYRSGDTIVVHDPPEVDDDGRVWELNLVLASESVRWSVDIMKPEA